MRCLIVFPLSDFNMKYFYEEARISITINEFYSHACLDGYDTERLQFLAHGCLVQVCNANFKRGQIQEFLKGGQGPQNGRSLGIFKLTSKINSI